MVIRINTFKPKESLPSGNEPRWIAEPFLHIESGYIYNPLTDRNISTGEPGYEQLGALIIDGSTLANIREPIKSRLMQEGWIVDRNKALANRFLLKYVSLEAHTVCNQKCYFCPVSVNPRESYFMPTQLYENIVEQLAEYRGMIEAVFMINYNEPTLDRRFVDQVRLLIGHGLPPAVNTNGSGLTPARADALMEMGGLRYLSVNLSTTDRERYRKDRGMDHLALVMKNLNYVKDRQLAQQMDLAVLGVGDEDHRRDFEQISNYFSGSYFNVKYFEIMDRAGYLPVGLSVSPESRRPLQGCNNLGSRPFQHLHITPQGKCVLCCEDYDEKYIVGDLTRQTVTEVLTGSELAKMRQWVYGQVNAPDDFMCSRCIFARFH